MPKIYKDVAPLERYLKMTENGVGVDIGLVDGNGGGLGCLIHVHGDNKTELVRYNSADNTGMVLSKYGTIIPTVDIREQVNPMVVRKGNRVIVRCLNNTDVDLSFAESLAFSLLNLCYEMRKDAQS